MYPFKPIPNPDDFWNDEEEDEDDFYDEDEY